MYEKRQTFRVSNEIWVEEHDDYVRF